MASSRAGKIQGVSSIVRLLRGVMPGRPASGRVKAVWRGVVLAESDAAIVLEGNHYFPPEDVERIHLHESEHRTVCPWKGSASYFDVEVNGARREGGAWTYRNPSPVARKIKDHVAFAPGIQVLEAGSSRA